MEMEMNQRQLELEMVTEANKDVAEANSKIGLK